MFACGYTLTRMPRRGRLTPRMSQRKKERFLAAYARLGNASAAAEETGIARKTHTRWLQSSEQYRKAFDEAEDQATEVLEREALRRAVKGTEEPVYFNGQQVGTTRRFSDVLLIFLLKSKRPDVYRERYDARLTANLNVQSAVKVVHEYHDAPPAIEANYHLEQQPNRALMSATEAEPGQLSVSQASTSSTGTEVPCYIEADATPKRLLYRTLKEADTLEPPVPEHAHSALQPEQSSPVPAADQVRTSLSPPSPSCTGTTK
jgi:hypothetical protein